ncbi:MAG: hypothetical protein RL026_1017 [Pseudomonadota bacterium]
MPLCSPSPAARRRRTVMSSGWFVAALLAGTAATAGAGQDCDRACLESMVERYLDAVVANRPDRLPLAPAVRFTEDGQQLAMGDGLWNTLKAKGSYRLFVTDVAAGQVAVLATIDEDHRDADKSTPALLALRLKLREGQIHEVEQIVVRDEKAAQRVAAQSPHPLYRETVPVGERPGRAELVRIGNLYFAGLQRNDGKGDYPFADDCDRLENGMRSTNAPTPAGEVRPDPRTARNYSAQWSCREQFESGLMQFVNRIRDRRFVAIDEERGIVFAFGFFDHSGGSARTFRAPDGRLVTAGPVQPWTWQIAELFKIEKGQIRKIDAFLQRVPYGMNSGWSTWSQGMSEHPRDVSME